MEEITVEKIKKTLLENHKLKPLDNYSLLNYAVSCNYFDYVKFLVENGADLNSDSDFSLAFALNEGNFEIIKYLCSVRKHMFSQLSTGLRWATQKGYFDCVKYVVEDQVKKYSDEELFKNNFKKHLGASLRIGIINRDYDFCKFLIDNGAEIELFDYNLLEEFKLVVKRRENGNFEDFYRDDLSLDDLKDRIDFMYQFIDKQ